MNLVTPMMHLLSQAKDLPLRGLRRRASCSNHHNEDISNAHVLLWNFRSSQGTFFFLHKAKATGSQSLHRLEGETHEITENSCLYFLLINIIHHCMRHVLSTERKSELVRVELEELRSERESKVLFYFTSINFHVSHYIAEN